MQPEGSKYEETKDSFFYQVFGRKTREKSCFSFMNRVIYPVYRMFRKIFLCNLTESAKIEVFMKRTKYKF